MDDRQIQELCDQGRYFLEEQDFVSARQCFESSISIDPHRIDALEGLATAQFLLDDSRAALETYHALAQLDLAQPRYYVNMGAILNRMGEYQRAIEVLRKAVHRDRHNADAFYNQGFAYRKLGQLALAATAYKDAIRHNPNMPDAHNNLGNVFFEQGNLQQAQTSFQKALELDPEFERAKTGLAKTENALREQRAARGSLGRLVEAQAPGQARPAPPRAIRQMSDAERASDRREISRLSGEIEVLNEQCVLFLRNNVEPALQALQKEFAQMQSRHLQEAVARYQSMLEQWDTHRRRLRRKVLELRAHEEIVNTPELDLASLGDLVQRPPE